ncbi:MAG: guanylate kinase [Dorea sp.]
MGKIFYMMGKSSSGKDTLFKEIREKFPELRTVILYTSRPIRDGETDGVEYYFVTNEILDQYKEKNRLIEMRSYPSMYGEWQYATVDDGQVNLDESDYIIIGTLESYVKMKEYYGEDKLIPVYIEVEDGERLQRALLREREQLQPKYDEMCRRFLADQKDFSEEKLQEAGITRRFRNESKVQCLEEIVGVIHHGKL